MEISTELEERLKELTEVFLTENQKLNLSAFRNFDQCWAGNVLDSLAGVEKLEVENVLDIGTGGGFPLLPLAIAYPNVEFTGIDSTQKKIDAIERIVSHLELKNVKLEVGRCEELGHEAAHREQYDLVTARAVAPLNVLLEFASPFVKPSGQIWCWKSLNCEQELEDSLLARAELSCQLSNQIEYDLGGDWGQRQIIVFEKRAPLNDKYPREIGIPKKDPLV